MFWPGGDIREVCGEFETYRGVNEGRERERERERENGRTGSFSAPSE